MSLAADMEATSEEFTARWQANDQELKCGDPAWIMGILNLTPDSFSDGGLHAGRDAAIRRAEEMVGQGAKILDIGGESSRPGAQPVAAAEEIQRTRAVVGELKRRFPQVLVSIDTTKSAVARSALDQGADIINDISGFCADPEMVDLAAQSDCGVVLMHMKGTPQTMQVAPSYGDVVSEMREYFSQRLAVCLDRGIRPERICFDPGIGFGKAHEHNLALLNSLSDLAPKGHLLLLGVSRKSVIGRCLGDAEMSLRDWPTVALTARARRDGVLLHRVHEVDAASQALRMTEALMAKELS